MSSSSSRFNFSGRKSITEPREEIIPCIAHNNVVKLTVAYLLRVSSRCFILFLLELIFIHLFSSIVKVIEQQVQIFFMVYLHHILIYRQIIFTIDLEFYFVFAMLIVISWWLMIKFMLR